MSPSVREHRIDSPDDLRVVQPWRFVVKLLLLIGLASMFAAGVVGSDRMAITIACQIGLGLLMAHAVELAHQCIHKTATGHAAIDHFLGWMLALPSLVSFHFYQYFHLQHHVHNGTEDDEESFGYAYGLLTSPSRVKRIRGAVLHLSQLRHYVIALERMGLAVRGLLVNRLQSDAPRMRARKAHAIQRDYQVMAGLVVAAMAVAVVLGPTWVVQLWLVPLLIGYGPTHALIELPEHYGCDTPNANVLVNTRSIKAGLFLRWLSNNNCDHVEHHWDMTIPPGNLPRLGQFLRAQRRLVHLEESYPRFYGRLAVSIWTGRPMPRPPVVTA